MTIYVLSQTFSCTDFILNVVLILWAVICKNEILDKN